MCVRCGKWSIALAKHVARHPSPACPIICLATEANRPHDGFSRFTLWHVEPFLKHLGWEAGHV